MIDLQNTIDNLEQNIRWIEDIECHQFPGWGNVVMAMRDAVGVIETERNAMRQLMSELQETLETMNKHEEEIKRLTDPVKPKYFQNEQLFPYCGNCGKLLPVAEGSLHHMKYCGECGRKVDWSR